MDFDQVIFAKITRLVTQITNKNFLTLPRCQISTFFSLKKKKTNKWKLVLFSCFNRLGTKIHEYITYIREMALRYAYHTSRVRYPIARKGISIRRNPRKLHSGRISHHNPTAKQNSYAPSLRFSRSFRPRGHRDKWNNSISKGWYRPKKI